MKQSKASEKTKKAIVDRSNFKAYNESAMNVKIQK